MSNHGATADLTATYARMLKVERVWADNDVLAAVGIDADTRARGKMHADKARAEFFEIYGTLDTDALVGYGFYRQSH